MVIILSYLLIYLFSYLFGLPVCLSLHHHPSYLPTLPFPTIPHSILPYYTLSYSTPLHPTLHLTVPPYPTQSSPTITLPPSLSYPVIPQSTLPCLTLPDPTPLHPTLSSPVQPYPTPLHLTLLYPVLTYHTLPHSTPPYPLLPFQSPPYFTLPCPSYSTLLYPWISHERGIQLLYRCIPGHSSECWPRYRVVYLRGSGPSSSRKSDMLTEGWGEETIRGRTSKERPPSMRPSGEEESWVLWNRGSLLLCSHLSVVGCCCLRCNRGEE